MQLEEEQILELADFDINRVPKFIHELLTSDEKVLQERWDSCNSCDFLTRRLTCKKCRCFMRLKTRIAKMKCPIGRWDKI